MPIKQPEHPSMSNLISLYHEKSDKLLLFLNQLHKLNRFLKCNFIILAGLELSQYLVGALWGRTHWPGYIFILKCKLQKQIQRYKIEVHTSQVPFSLRKI